MHISIKQILSTVLQYNGNSVVSDDHSVINTLDWQRLTRRSVRYSQKICRAGAIRVMSVAGES